MNIQFHVRQSRVILYIAVHETQIYPGFKDLEIFFILFYKEMTFFFSPSTVSSLKKIYTVVNIDGFLIMFQGDRINLDLKTTVILSILHQFGMFLRLFRRHRLWQGDTVWRDTVKAFKILLFKKVTGVEGFNRDTGELQFQFSDVLKIHIFIINFQRNALKIYFKLLISILYLLILKYIIDIPVIL